VKTIGATASAFLTVFTAWILLATAGPPPVQAVATAAACPVISARLGLHWPYYVSPHVAFPENSLGAIGGAHTAGAPKIEVDVEYAHDGTPMAIHDGTVNRTTAHTGSVSSYTSAQLTAMPLRMEGLGPANGWMTTQHLPTVQAVLTATRLDGMTASIEVKPAALTYAQARQLLRVIWAAGGTANSVEANGDVRSYIPAVLAEMRTAGYWGRLTLITGTEAPLTAGSPYWQESAEYNAGGAAVTAAQVAALHAAGVQADIYTPENSAGFAMIPAGADQVTTDNVHGMQAWEAAHC
jgi:glycerophosphoryl diester phosphodiesterase